MIPKMSNHLVKRCPHCGNIKSIREFHKNKSQLDGLAGWCKECTNEDKKRYYQKNKEKILRANHKRWFTNLEKSRRKQRERYKKKMKDPEFRKKQKEHQKRWRKDNKEKCREYNKEYRKKIRLVVFTHYGGDPPKCACCGESHMEFLTIDHKDGKGIKYGKGRKFRTNTEFFVWLIKNNFPEKNLRILCYNCNCSIGHYGYCPHKL